MNYFELIRTQIWDNMNNHALNTVQNYAWECSAPILVWERVWRPIGIHITRRVLNSVWEQLHE